MERLKPRQQQAIDTKQKIYESAMTLIEKQGFEETKISDICKVAGVSVGSYYRYFDSKFDILVETLMTGDDYFKKNVEGKLDTASAREALLLYFWHYAEKVLQTQFDIIKELYNPKNKLFSIKDRHMQKVLVDAIHHWQERGQLIANLSTDEMCNYLFIAARGVVFDWCLHDASYDLHKAMADFMNRLIYGLETK